MSKIKLPRDSLICYIPINVTADLGVAMKRLRKKRLEQYKNMFFHLGADKIDPAASTNHSNEDDGDVPYLPTEGDDSQRSGENESDAESQGRKQRAGVDVDETRCSEVRREEFSSVVDYLEAKYAKGVMIDDLDERVREKKRKDGITGGLTKGVNSGGGDHLGVLSDSEAGSCYSDDSGNFIDDSDLRTDVAHQILASSAFGTTKIEADAAAKTRGDDSDEESTMSFFVNVGDLEMEDGWEDQIEEDNDWLDAMKKSKGKKRKRVSKDGANTKGGASNQKKPAKKPKTSNEKDKKASEKDKKISEKKKVKSPSKKELAKIPKNETTSSKKKGTSQSKSKDESNLKTPKKEATPTPKLNKNSSQEKEEMKARVDASRKEVTSLKRKSTRLHNKCVEEIQNMRDEHLPRKLKSGGTSKVAVKIPQGKNGGDTISFANPHIPGQRLQVTIPKGKSSNESFNVTVPLPSIKSGSKSENKFTKECIDALDKYSSAYDDWLQAEANHRELVGKTPKKGKDAFKVGVERLKKFDAMITAAFPKNLETPIEAAFLRLLVRRKRQSQSKKLKVVKTETPIKKNEKKTVEITIPGTGVKFPKVKFQKLSFA